MLVYLLLIISFFPLIQSLFLMNHDCINCKHFCKSIYIKSSDKTIKPKPQSIGYCKLGLDINTPPNIREYKTVEEFRTDKQQDNCGTDGKFFRKL
jgi:hypothetical protein